MRRVALTLSIAFPLACHSSRDDDLDAALDPSAPDGVAGDRDGSRPDAGTSGGPDGATESPSCYQGCATPADCGNGTAVNDADNYDCRGGRCLYLGCNSTSECPSSVYACGTVPGLSTPTCLHTCSVAADCAIGNAAYDTDNYRCTGGLCEYTGCLSHEECAQAFSADYGCHRPAGWLWPYCTLRCSIPGDCVIPTGGTLYDADNYACDDGFCRHIGCHDDGECRDAFLEADAVCR